MPNITDKLNHIKAISRTIRYNTENLVWEAQERNEDEFVSEVTTQEAAEEFVKRLKDKEPLENQQAYSVVRSSTAGPGEDKYRVLVQLSKLTQEELKAPTTLEEFEALEAREKTLIDDIDSMRRSLSSHEQDIKALAPGSKITVRRCRTST